VVTFYSVFLAGLKPAEIELLLYENYIYAVQPVYNIAISSFDNDKFRPLVHSGAVRYFLSDFIQKTEFFAFMDLQQPPEVGFGFAMSIWQP